MLQAGTFASMQVAGQLKTKTAEACEALHKKFKSLLSLPKPLLNVTAFLAVVKDSLKLESSEAETVSDELQGSASSNALDSDDNNDAIKGEADDAAEDTKPVRRSKRAPQRKYADEVAFTYVRPNSPSVQAAAGGGTTMCLPSGFNFS